MNCILVLLLKLLKLPYSIEDVYLIKQFFMFYFKNKLKFKSNDQIYYEFLILNRDKFCIICGSNIKNYVETVKDSIDYVPCEIECKCPNCNFIINYWAYGHYDPGCEPTYDMYLKLKERNEK